MTAPNNLCAVLIAYGSHAPGGANHRVYAALPGAWRKGFIHQTCHEAPDDIGPGQQHLIDAWLLELPGQGVEMFTPAYEALARERHELWTGLDAAMGAGWRRTEMRWWPEGALPVVAEGGMLVANIHVPVQRFTYLANQDDVPHPDEEDDIEKLWHRVRRGEKNYDGSHFIALIKDAQPAQLDGMFGELPRSGEFLARLKRLFNDHLLSETSVLWDGGERSCLYVCPLQRNALPQPALIELARQDIGQRVAFLRQRGFHAEADVLARLRFEHARPDDPVFEPAAAAMESCEDELRYAGPDRPRWMYCLREACYGIAASFELQDWLMLALRESVPDFDLEPAYRLWKAGGAWVLDGETCCVHEVARRQA
jgi:hypothetical protein